MPIEYTPQRHKREHEFVSELIPIEQEGAFENEPEGEYLERMRRLLPSFPDEVLLQWFHRHGSHAHQYDWLGYRGLSFEREEWATQRILGEIRSWPGDDPLDG